MIDLRFIECNGKKVLQWRQIMLQIGWAKCDDQPVIQPVGPVSLLAEKNWSEWEDVPLVGSCIHEQEEDPTPYCSGCMAKTKKDCDCGPIAENN